MAFDLVNRATRMNVVPSTLLKECGLRLKSDDPKMTRIFNLLSLADLYSWSKYYGEAVERADAQRTQTEAEIAKIKGECHLADVKEVTDECLHEQVKAQTLLAEFGTQTPTGELELETMTAGIPHFYAVLYKKRRRLRQLIDGLAQERDPLALLRDLDETFVVGDSGAHATGLHKAAELMVFGGPQGSDGAARQALVVSKPLRLHGKKEGTATVSMATVGLPLSHTYLILDLDVSARYVPVTPLTWIH